MERANSSLAEGGQAVSQEAEATKSRLPLARRLRGANRCHEIRDIVAQTLCLLRQFGCRPEDLGRGGSGLVGRGRDAGDIPNARFAAAPGAGALTLLLDRIYVRLNHGQLNLWDLNGRAYQAFWIGDGPSSIRLGGGAPARFVASPASFSAFARSLRRTFSRLSVDAAASSAEAYPLSTNAGMA